MSLSFSDSLSHDKPPRGMDDEAEGISPETGSKGDGDGHQHDVGSYSGCRRRRMLRFELKVVLGAD